MTNSDRHFNRTNRRPFPSCARNLTLYLCNINSLEQIVVPTNPPLSFGLNPFSNCGIHSQDTDPSWRFQFYGAWEINLRIRALSCLVGKKPSPSNQQKWRFRNKFVLEFSEHFSPQSLSCYVVGIEHSAWGCRCNSYSRDLFKCKLSHQEFANLHSMTCSRICVHHKNVLVTTIAEDIKKFEWVFFPE